MKKIVYLIALISSIAVAQEHHFKAERKEVSWQMAFKTSETDILTLIDKNHAKISVDKVESTGKGMSLNCDCKNGSWYFEQSFNLFFTVEIKENSYLITVTDIVFDGEGETNNNNRLENYVLRIGQSKFHPTEKNLINLTCLEHYFIKLFQIPNSEITIW